MLDPQRLEEARRWLRAEFLRNQELELIAQAPLPIYVTDEGGEITCANDYAKARQGPLLGRPLGEIIDARTVALLMEHAAREATVFAVGAGEELVVCRHHEHHYIWAVTALRAPAIPS